MNKIVAMFTEDEVKNLFLFLDRVELKGHSERLAMNQIESSFMKGSVVGEDLEAQTETEDNSAE